MTKTETRISWILLVHMGLITCHTLMDMLPLFFGGQLGSPHGSGMVPQAVYWATAVQYVFPGWIITLMLFTSHRGLKILSLVLTALLALMNFSHWFSHVPVTPFEPTAAIVLTTLQINLFVVVYYCWKWIREN